MDDHALFAALAASIQYLSLHQYGEIMNVADKLPENKVGIENAIAAIAYLDIPSLCVLIPELIGFASIRVLYSFNSLNPVSLNMVAINFTGGTAQINFAYL